MLHNLVAYSIPCSITMPLPSYIVLHLLSATPSRAERPSVSNILCAFISQLIRCFLPADRISVRRGPEVAFSLSLSYRMVVLCSLFMS
jgi:hypothetical protein